MLSVIWIRLAGQGRSQGGKGGGSGVPETPSHTLIPRCVNFYKDLTAILITDLTAFGELEPPSPALPPPFKNAGYVFAGYRNDLI